MKRVFIGIMFLIFAAGISTTYAKASDDLKVQINKAVTAKGIKIEFVEMVEDSRCPADVQCVWAGNAKIKVRVTKNGKSQVLDLEMVNRGTKPNYGSYLIKLKALSPELRSNVRINRNAYIATIEVKKVK